jgi:hypothetical protein
MDKSWVSFNTAVAEGLRVFRYTGNYETAAYMVLFKNKYTLGGRDYHYVVGEPTVKHVNELKVGIWDAHQKQCALHV